MRAGDGRLAWGAVLWHGALHLGDPTLSAGRERQDGAEPQSIPWRRRERLRAGKFGLVTGTRVLPANGAGDSEGTHSGKSLCFPAEKGRPGFFHRCCLAHSLQQSQSRYLFSGLRAAD